MGDEKCVQNCEAKRPLRRPVPRWEDIRMDLGVWEVMDSIQLAQDRDQWRVFVNVVMKLRVW